MRTKLIALVGAAVAALLAVLMPSGSPASALETYTVTNENDSGPGSLRAAIDLAETDDDDSLIVFADGVETIELDSQLVYAHDESTTYSITVAGAVTITESGSWSSGSVPLLLFEDTAEIELRYLTFTGGYDGLGITDLVTSTYVTVAGVTSTGNDALGGWFENDSGVGHYMAIDFSDSSFSGNAGGFEVDQGYNNTADVDVTNSWFNDNDDGLGLEVYHDGAGSLYVDVAGSHFDGNDGTGLYVYSTNGGAYVTADGSTFDNSINDDGLNVQAYNGTSADVELTVTNSQAIGNYDEGFYSLRDSNSCCGAHHTVSFSHVETRDNGYNGIQVKSQSSTYSTDISFSHLEVVGNGLMDDFSGVYIQNDGDGPMDVTVTGSDFLSNGWDGLTIDDYTSSSLDVTTTGSVFRNNGDEGLDIYKSGGGGVYFTSTASRFVDNGTEGDDGEGLEIMNNDGGVYATVSASAFDGNDDDGVNLSDDDDNGCTSSSVEFTATSSSFDGNGGDGVDIDECGSGDVIVRSFLSSADGNGEKGYDLDEADGGVFNVITLLGSAADNGEEGISLEGGGGLALVLLTDLLGNGNGQTEFSPGIFSFVI